MCQQRAPLAPFDNQIPCGYARILATTMNFSCLWDHGNMKELLHCTESIALQCYGGSYPFVIFMGTYYICHRN